MINSKVESFRKFSAEENKTWEELFVRQSKLRSKQIYEIFDDGLNLLNISSVAIPDLDRVNAILYKETKFKGIPVTGHEDPTSFFPMLAKGEFPIGNFIRSKNDINYTPAPDVFHDLYGHLPFYANKKYADFSRVLGKRASKFIHNSAQLRQWERLFWFGLEFSLIHTQEGIRIFGAGLVSSFSETLFALSEEPEVIPFNIEKIRYQEFKIDEFQKKIFILSSEEQLYSCLDDFEKGCK